jgi:inositol-pentakisphosphate 2-kinase
MDEPFGLLITDMTADGDPGATLAELKPKWLNQSPSAPAAAHRCRTCALREMKNRESLMLGQKEQRSFCPLDLVSEKFEDVVRATGFIKGCKDRSRLARILYCNPTLQRLRSLQKVEEDVGLHGPAAKSRDMSLAMTLRDCTMFIKVSTTTSCEAGPETMPRCSILIIVDRYPMMKNAQWKSASATSISRLGPVERLDIGDPWRPS